MPLVCFQQIRNKDVCLPTVVFSELSDTGWAATPSENLLIVVCGVDVFSLNVILCINLLPCFFLPGKS